MVLPGVFILNWTIFAGDVCQWCRVGVRAHTITEAIARFWLGGTPFGSGHKKSPASGTPGAVMGEHLPSMRRRPVRNGLEEQTFHEFGKLVPAVSAYRISWLENGHRAALERYYVFLKNRLRAPLDRRTAQLVRTKYRNLLKCFSQGRRLGLTPGFP